MLRTALALSIILSACARSDSSSAPPPADPPAPRVGADRALGRWVGVETDGGGGTAIDAEMVIEGVADGAMHGGFALLLDNPAVAEWSAEVPFLLLTDATVIDFAIPDDESDGLGSMQCRFWLLADVLDYRRFIAPGVARIGRLRLAR